MIRNQIHPSHSGRNGPSQPPRIQARRDRRDRDHVDVLGQEEQREAHRAVLGVVPGDQLLLRFRKVERRAVGLGDAGGHVDQEAERLQEDVPLRDEAPPVARLVHHDLAQRQRAGQHDHRGQRQPVGQLVADHLRRRAQPAEQRVLAVRAPAGEHDAVDAHRGDREDHQHRDVDVGDLRAGSARRAARRASSRCRTARPRTPRTPCAVEMIGAIVKSSASAAFGRSSSLNISLMTSANGCSSPVGADPVRAVALLDVGADLALHPDHERRRQHQRVEDDEDQHELGDERRD